VVSGAGWPHGTARGVAPQCPLAYDSLLPLRSLVTCDSLPSSPGLGLLLWRGPTSPPGTARPDAPCSRVAAPGAAAHHAAPDTLLPRAISGARPRPLCGVSPARDMRSSDLCHLDACHASHTAHRPPEARADNDSPHTLHRAPAAASRTAGAQHPGVCAPRGVAPRGNPGLPLRSPAPVNRPMTDGALPACEPARCAGCGRGLCAPLPHTCSPMRASRLPVSSQMDAAPGVGGVCRHPRPPAAAPRRKRRNTGRTASPWHAPMACPLSVALPGGMGTSGPPIR
jgi:hypothetical protein